MGTLFKLMLGMMGLAACSNPAAPIKSSDSLQNPDQSRAEQIRGPEIRFLHFNIKELSTPKFFMNNPQVAAAADIIREANADLYSINEIQYDKRDIPLIGMPGEGKNPQRLIQAAKMNPQDFYYSFFEANTGKKAHHFANGEYLHEPNQDTMAMADQENFGIFPGQYSTALISRFPIKKRIENSSLRWQEWDPTADFSSYEQGDKTPVADTVELFDKNFTDSIVEIKGRDVHVITFHTVPAFNFGNPKSINAVRNAAQLEFLEWYLTGKCEEQSPSKVRACKTMFHPLKENDVFIAVGDLNTDLHSKDPGAAILKRIYENPRVQKAFAQNRDPKFQKQKGEENSLVTYLGDGNDLKQLQLQLDYFLFSTHWKIHSLSVFAPASEYQEKGCYADHSEAQEQMLEMGTQSGRVSEVIHRREDEKPYCVISVSSGFAQRRRASDHLPVLAEISLPSP